MPSKRLLQLLGHESDIEALLKRMTRDATESLGKSFCVAVLAARADLGAAANRVPRGVSPFDCAAVTHKQLRFIGEYKAKMTRGSNVPATLLKTEEPRSRSRLFLRSFSS